ncbi:MAG: Ankyrin, partial [Gammaproteobacteria bacterium]|nr:Ankyrin [Gammaproteobacteria bacterium]
MAFSYKFVDQANLISKLNAYLTAQGRATIDTLGYCNGLAALYLYARSQDKQQEFLEQIQSILEKKDSDLAPDPIIDNFLEKILLLQAPSVFLQNSAQTNLDRSIELVRTRNQPQLRHEFNLAFAFSQAELAKVLNEIPDNKMLLLGSPAHAIGLYKKEGKYFLFDANSINIPEMEISSAESAAYFIKLSMETTGDENQAEFLPLQMNIFDRADRPAGQYKKPEQTVRELLAANPKVARTSLWQGYSPLHTAAFAGNAEVVKVLLENGSDPNAVATVPEHAHTHLSDTYTPLHLAVFSGNQAAVSALLEHGAKVEIKNGHNGSALALAVLQRNEQVAETLLKFNADPNESNAQGQSLLRSAVSSDNGAMAKLLLEYKAQPNLADMNGVTPLMIAVMNNNLSMASLLLENG